MLYRALTAGPWRGLGELLDRLPDDASRARIRALAIAPPTTPPDPHKLADNVTRLREKTLVRRLEEIHAERARLNATVDGDRIRELSAEWERLERDRRALLEG